MTAAPAFAPDARDVFSTRNRNMKAARPRPPRSRRVTSYRLRLRAGGAVFCLGTVLIGLAAIDSDNNILLILFGLCLGAILVSLLSGWRTLRGLSISRLAPDIAVAGQPMELRYTVTNHRGWWPAREIHVCEIFGPHPPAAKPETYIPFLRGGEAVTLTAPALSKRRGRIVLSCIQVSTSFPFGIFVKVIRHRAEDEIIVFPTLGRLRGNPLERSKLADAADGGAMLVRGRGDDEFYGLREYRQGDNPRRIHWRRSAHTGQLMIREMARTRDPQLWCVIDTRIDPADAEQREKLETTISAAATVICDVLEQGTRVGLICSGDPLLVLPPGAGRHRRKRLLRELAVRTTNTEDVLSRQLQGVPLPTRWRGSCVLFAVKETDDVRAVSRFLRRTLGPTKICVPGAEAFDSLIAVPTSAVQAPAAAGAAT